MDLEQFNKWSCEFKTMLTELKEQEECIHSLPQCASLADSEYLNECETQICATKELLKIASDLDCTGLKIDDLS